MDEGKREKGLSYSCILLIVIAGMERFAYKGVASNLVTYLTDVVKMSNSSAAKTVNTWGGITSILPLFIAPFADSHLHRYTTILSSSFLYVLGLGALTWSASAWGQWSPENKEKSTAFLFLSLGLISLGQGGYNSSLQAFGADQLDEDDSDSENTDTSSSSPQPKKPAKSFFFQCWYFGICSGSLLGVTVMSYIQDTSGWVLGFAIPAVAMLVSVVFFALGSNIYVYKQGQIFHTNYKSVLSLVRSLKAMAFKVLIIRGGRISLPNVVDLELQEKPLCAQTTEHNQISEATIMSPKITTHIAAENAKVVLRLLPIWTTLLMFAVIFQLPATFFTKQGMTMKRDIGTFQIPPATLQSSITLSIIVLMPLYDKVLIPFTRLFTRRESGISVAQRIGAGMFLSIVAMVVAAIVENQRRFRRSPTLMSIFWLLPQYVLLGISDIFTVVGMQEFFYSEVPVRMRTMAFALYNGVFGVGSFLSAVLITVVEKLTGTEERESWFSNNMSEARLDKYYWFLALSSTVSLAVYVLCCRFFKTRRDSETLTCHTTVNS